MPGSDPNTATNILGSCDHVKSLPGSQCFPLSIGAGVVGLHYFLYSYHGYSRIYSKHIYTQNEAACNKAGLCKWWLQGNLNLNVNLHPSRVWEAGRGKHRWPGRHGLAPGEPQYWVAVPWEPITLRFHCLDSTPVTVPVTQGP